MPENPEEKYDNQEANDCYPGENPEVPAFFRAPPAQPNRLRLCLYPRPDRYADLFASNGKNLLTVRNLAPAVVAPHVQLPDFTNSRPLPHPLQSYAVESISVL